MTFLCLRLLVSIQLVSPASGDRATDSARNGESGVSIQLVSPASGDYVTFANEKADILLFPFN